MTNEYLFLVSDLFFRKTFDIVSILHSEFPEIKIILGVPEKGRLQRARAKLFYPGICELLRTNDTEASFTSDLSRISEKYASCRIVFLPIEENTTLRFIDYTQKNGRRNFVYLLPSKQSFTLAQDKYALNLYGLQNGFNAPLLYAPKHITPDADIYPLILKPRKGSGSKGIVRLFSYHDYTQKVREQIAGGEYVIQELIPNGEEVEGVFLLMHANQPVSAYSHARIRTSPPQGGVTVLSKATYNKDLIEEGSRLLTKLGWNGIAMLEYLYDRKTDRYKLIEINPRMWGSIMLSEYCGAGILKNYVRICMNTEIEPPSINCEARVRWLLPDLVYYLKRLGRIEHFWDFKNTCFINWSYARRGRALLFNICNVFNINSMLKFIRR